MSVAVIFLVACHMSYFRRGNHDSIYWNEMHFSYNILTCISKNDGVRNGN
jgi:hypothetical protein